MKPLSSWHRRQREPSVPDNADANLRPEERSLVRPYRSRERTGVTWLLRSSLHCTVVAALFLYLALARQEPRYAIGIFAMFVLYLGIRVYSARRLAGIMPRILQRYEERIAELEERLGKIDNDRVVSGDA